MRVRKVLWSNTEEPILVIMALLILIGTINVFSSSYVLAMEDYQDPYYFFKRHLIWLFLGTVFCAAFARMNYARLRNAPATWSAAGIISVLLLAVLFVGVEINGAKRWITFFGLQPAAGGICKAHQHHPLHKDISLTGAKRKKNHVASSGLTTVSV